MAPPKSYVLKRFFTSTVTTLPARARARDTLRRAASCTAATRGGDRGVRACSCRTRGSAICRARRWCWRAWPARWARPSARCRRWPRWARARLSCPSRPMTCWPFTYPGRSGRTAPALKNKWARGTVCPHGPHVHVHGKPSACMLMTANSNGARNVSSRTRGDGLVDDGPELAEGGLGRRLQPDHEVLVLVDRQRGGVAAAVPGVAVEVGGQVVAVQVLLVVGPGDAGLLRGARGTGLGLG